ncbi:unnamed protein product [Ostreobium quekettii]|uniref:Uncharacterized protein n=1 Tax=Ostreobium quekettii TaxID=121088 RepID=A0A8S1J780_9CHLO|nr:unnamed protein product [Ostreobium quekettii]|eukprot:evm.model.scf_128EXC.9 EVM.evm.TU.scf_128EXC.9   scf_128EXC:76805-79975(-)
MRTCRRDDTQCLKGSNVWESLEVCCARGVAFPNGCQEVELSKEECWVAQMDFPSKRCGPSRSQCDRGWKVYETEEECCEEDAAFPEGCTELPPVPCWIVDVYDPVRLCRKVTDVATCYRGWGVFESEEICCAKGAGFPEGCTKDA